MTGMVTFLYPLPTRAKTLPVALFMRTVPTIANVIVVARESENVDELCDDADSHFCFS